MSANVNLIGIGLYTSAEAARLLRVPTPRVRRWMRGYHYAVDDQRRRIEPLWTPQIPPLDGSVELGFRDLTELRFVVRFLEAGLSLQMVRTAQRLARIMICEERPFSTCRFATDGRRIFLEMADGTEDPKLIDLANRQFAFRTLIEPSFKDLDFEAGVAARWWPMPGRKSIVIDPQRSFGQPIAAEYGVPTATLAAAVGAEGSVKAAARAYEVAPSVVRDALDFEVRLAA